MKKGIDGKFGFDCYMAFDNANLLEVSIYMCISLMFFICLFKEHGHINQLNEFKAS